MKRACAECLGWIDGGKGFGECHGGPPSATSVSGKWPWTRYDGWCLAFVPAVPVDEPTPQPPIPDERMEDAP